METWSYSNLVPKHRQDQLLAIESFELVTEQVANEMSVLCYHIQPCDDDARYARPVYCIQVSEELFDAFFNSPSGYRGSYFKSPFFGLECNRHLIERLLPRVFDWASQNSPGYNAQFCQESLLAISAKVWLAESTLELCTQCEGEWSRPCNDQAEIINDRWNLSELPDSKFGRKAPLCTKIRLFCAFLSSHGDELIPKRKRYRHYQISREGWS